MADAVKVHFVGAGPGAEDLITLRGMRLLGEADVVIYAGSLVNPALLNYAPGAKALNSALMTLEEIIAAIAEAVAEEKTVVRLHTGDQSVYGAVREQMDALDSLGIAYDSCPGVSAAFAAAASLNLEYTLPTVSQSLIITRMAGRTAVPEKESISSFASHGASMAIYLSTGLLGQLQTELICGGYQADTPAAIVYKASWPEEKSFICTVGTLAETAQQNDIQKTSIILVGEAIAAGSYEKSRLYAPDFSTEYRRGTEL